MKLSRFGPQPADQLHPGAWWLWAFTCALSASNIKHPVVLLLLCISIAMISMSRIATQAQRQSFMILFKIALWFIGLRIVLQTLLGYPIGTHVAVRLPAINLPTWLSGLRLGGVITYESLLTAFAEGLRMGAIILAFAAATNLTTPSRVLRTLPAALHELGMIIVIAITFIPHLMTDAKRLLQAARWRGHTTSRIKLLSTNVVALCEAALDRSTALAGSLTTRGYAMHRTNTKFRNRIFLGLLLVALSAGTALIVSSALISLVLLALGVLTIGFGLRGSSSQSTRTKYRPDTWRQTETMFALSALLMAACAYIFKEDIRVFDYDGSFESLIPSSPWVIVFLVTVLSPLWLSDLPAHQLSLHTTEDQMAS